MNQLATALPGTFRLGLARGAIELKQFFRQKEHALFTFSLPPFLLLILGSVFRQAFDNDGTAVSQMFTASMIGSGIISTSFVSMGIGVALDREDGTLKRLRGTPLPAVAYFLGKIVLVGVSSVAQVVLLLTIGLLMFDLTLPTDPARWVTFAWVFVLAVVTCSLLGIAVSSVARSAQSASSVTNFPYLGLQFISGVFINPITMLPTAMVTVSSFFPVKWICQGFRAVFLPEHMAAREMAGSWELGMIALVLSSWCVLGLALCRLTFRWTNTGR
ncbi:ABC-2 type transport system permease protein [Tamaricihabitans halophyticus]|uniref:Transport permease protein n=1 Tax=Tamaricihabitans halophyticus TaxID=1262583 RepID=A0A4V2SUZ7_9PSEU|nr:ABC transporter permease [Tamaricihabitans halophyticus]TCP56536.1 ABC-2 type transport system permease protein [Tamaricihabitans halophyticus]